MLFGILAVVGIITGLISGYWYFKRTNDKVISIILGVVIVLLFLLLGAYLVVRANNDDLAKELSRFMEG